MAKKIDFSRAKEFLFNHGEKVALGTCAALALILGLWGIWSAMGAGKPEDSSKTYAQHFKEIYDKISMQIVQPAPQASKDEKPKMLLVWDPIKSEYVPSPWLHIDEANGDKRHVPKVAAISSDPKNIHWDYVGALLWTHDKAPGQLRTIMGLNSPDLLVGQPPPDKEKKGKNLPPVEIVMPPFAKRGLPKRMVVVHMRFPMKQQVELFRQALKIPTQEEFFTKFREDLPFPRSIEVRRVEVLADNKFSKEEILIGYDEEGKFVVNAELEKVLREAMYDEQSPEAFKEYLWHGLAMPMPKLANKKYPKFEFTDFDIDWAFLDDPDKAPAAAGGGFNPPPGFPPRGGKEMKGGLLPGGGSGLPGGGGLGKKPFGPPPEPGGPVEPGVEFILKPILPEKSFKFQNPELEARIFGKSLAQDVNLFHVLGRFAPKPDAAVNPGPGVPPGGGPGGGMANPEAYFSAWDYRQVEGVPGGGGPVPQPGKLPGGFEGGPKKPPMPLGGGGGMPPTPTFPNWDRDALVRFIDVDVKPGKTYRYAVRVRLANPNFEKPTKELAYGGLAINKDLEPSEWARTEDITIPEEFFLYAVDQPVLDDWANPKNDKNFTYKPEVNSFAAFQIHEWIGQRQDNKFGGSRLIGDWVIAERQLVKRGEPIGKNLTVQTPVWEERKDAFLVPQDIAREDKKKGFSPKGAHVDLVKNGKPAYLVDFTGGKKLTGKGFVDEEVAVDALILMPDGQLKLLNSRDAADSKERQDRVLDVRKRVEDVNHQVSPAMKNGPGPGPGPGPGLPKKGFGGSGGS